MCTESRGTMYLVRVRVRIRVRVRVHGEQGDDVPAVAVGVALDAREHDAQRGLVAVLLGFGLGVEPKP